MFQDFNKWFSSKLEEKKPFQPAHKYRNAKNTSGGVPASQLALAATQGGGGGRIKVDI